MNQRGIALCVNLAIVLGVANWIILDKEDLLASGRRLLLDVGNRDPRSLVQGDYMQLHYHLATDIAGRIDEEARGEGQVVLAVDGNDVGSFRRLYDGGDLAAGELLLRYRIRPYSWNRVRVAAEEFFFQEGMAEVYANPRYAELRVDAAGNSLLVGLCDADGIRLGGRGQ